MEEEQGYLRNAVEVYRSAARTVLQSERLLFFALYLASAMRAYGNAEGAHILIKYLDVA